jgi:hypothetical protein
LAEDGNGLKPKKKKCKIQETTHDEGDEIGKRWNVVEDR